MNPFFTTDDVLLINQINFSGAKTIGHCFLIDGKIHRQTASGAFKGDRLLYNDEIKTTPSAIVIGKIIERKNKKYLTNHSNPILFNISKAIAFLSRYNFEKNKFRSMLLVLIILLSKLHCRLELLTLEEFQS
jgi:hypothetical protein